MKKITFSILVVAIMSTISFANSIEHFIAEKNTIRGMVDNTLILISKNPKTAGIKSRALLSSVKYQMGKELCKDIKTKNLINNGMKVMFIDLSKESNETTIIVIDRCD